MRTKKLIIALIVIIALFVCTLPAADGDKTAENLPELNKKAGLPDYLEYAALNNPGLRARFKEWKAALLRVPQVKALPDPKFKYGYLIKKVETRVGPQKQRVGISQKFPWFGTLELKGDVASERAKMKREQYEAEKLKLFYRVKKAYYEYYYLGKALLITEENLELMKNFESIARSKYKVGSANVIKAQVELGKLEDRVGKLRDMRAPLSEKLEALLNMDSDKTLPYPSQLPEINPDLDEEELMKTLEENNPALQKLDFKERKYEKQKKLARKKFYPDFNVGLNYLDTGEARMPGVDDSGKDPVVAMFSINIPVHRKKYKAGVKEAVRLKSSVEKDREDRKNSFRSELQMAVFKVRDARRKIDLYKDTLLVEARQSLEVTQKSFETGKVDFLDLIEAQRTLLEFELSYQRARADLGIGYAGIQKLTGSGRGKLPDKKITGEKKDTDVLKNIDIDLDR